MVFLCLLAFCMYVCCFACVDYASLGIRCACTRLATCVLVFACILHVYCFACILACNFVSMFVQKACKMRAVLFCAFCEHFGMQFCLDLFACIGYGMLAVFCDVCIFGHISCMHTA